MNDDIKDVCTKEAAKAFYYHGIVEKFEKKVFGPKSLQDFENFIRYRVDKSTKTNTAFALFEKGKRNKVISIALCYLIDKEAKIDPDPYNM